MSSQSIFLTVDTVVFCKSEKQTLLLLIQRKNEPYKEQWALPGGFVEDYEDLETAALRELKEETGVALTSCEQLYAFGKPGRDPRRRTVSIAHVGFVKNKITPRAADDAGDARWFGIDKLPDLAFDHKEIINLAISRFLPDHSQ
ncbi:NUDIX domain-containing protein [Planktosalinus lacus]|uniref:NUDIX hydrolase n=1 Tax=Planktosalinus lacus TaxID=1526573 RepID=A0A8J2VAW4_9FLAO|nr:NUDIX hydrolase [Planktosalinus lacus]GGD94096.1 NUDIX hydrolase [Planktosalinus lacus]